MASVAFEELRSLERFRPEALQPFAPFTQSWGYGEWQRAVGRPVRRLVGMRGGACVAALQLIKYPLAAGRSYWYAPYGPVIKEGEGKEAVRALYEEMSGAMRDSQAVFTRLDFFPPLAGGAAHAAGEYFRRAPRATYRASPLQPRAEWVLDLKRTEDEFLREMHRNTRYSIRAAERRGVRTEVASAPLLLRHFTDFYGLMQETAVRDGFLLHSRDYYEAAFQVSAAEGNAFLVLALYGEKLLAAHFITLFAGQAHFVFGGSSTSGRERMGSHAAQWRAIREAKARGASRYNFGGVSSENEPREKWEGLSSFKRKFGGALLRHGPFYDVVRHKLWYYAYGARKYLQNIWR